MTAKYLVVGGAGYIGSHMVRMLLDMGVMVEVVDNLSRGHADAVGTARLHVADIRDHDALASIFEQSDFDAVFHFAALAYVGESTVDPALYYDVNVNGSRVLCDVMRKFGKKTLIFSSTCAVYGEPEYLPIDEDHPKNPVNPYGRTKLIVEGLLEDYCSAYGFSSVSLRYFNAAGADLGGRLGERHMPETHLIPLVLDEALGHGNDSGSLMIYGDDFPTYDGTCIRDYVHVQDLCRAHLSAAEWLVKQRRPVSRAINLGTGRGHSVREVIDACRRITGVDIQAGVAPRREGDPACLYADAGYADRELNWQPQHVELDDMVCSAWRWMKLSNRITDDGHVA